MTQVDYIVFLVAAVLALIPIDGRLAWGLIGIWALLKLLHVI